MNQNLNPKPRIRTRIESERIEPESEPDRGTIRRWTQGIGAGPNVDILRYIDCNSLLHTDSPYARLSIAIPAIVVLATCPFILAMYEPIYAFAYGDYGVRPDNINDAIGTFLTPASLIYGLLYSTTYEWCLEKLNKMSSLLMREMNCCDQLCMYVINLNVHSKSKIKVLKQIFAVGLSLQDQMRDVPTKTQLQEYSQRIWLILPSISDMLRDGTGDAPRSSLKKTSSYGSLCESSGTIDHLNALFTEKVVDIVSTLSETVSERVTLQRTHVNIFKWVFMYLLSFSSFLGVLLIDSGSTSLQTFLCLVTVVGIGLLSFAISDLDSPFHGRFNVNKVKKQHNMFLTKMALFLSSSSGSQSYMQPHAAGEVVDAIMRMRRAQVGTSQRATSGRSFTKTVRFFGRSSSEAEDTGHRQSRTNSGANKRRYSSAASFRRRPTMRGGSLQVSPSKTGPGMKKGSISMYPGLSRSDPEVNGSSPKPSPPPTILPKRAKSMPSMTNEIEVVEIRDSSELVDV